MIPRADITAFATAGALGMGVIPHLPQGHYTQGTAAVAAALLVFMGQEMDRSAQRRVAEIERMAGLFAQAASLVPATLADELIALAARPLPPPSLAALDAHRAPMLAGLVRLHEWLEAEGGEAAHTLEVRLLDHLRQTAESKALVIPAMG